jgi:hypothetical protein
MPLQRGGRFSRNARKPSRESALVRCPRINWTGIGCPGGADPLDPLGVPSGPDAPVPLLEPRCQPPRRHRQADEASAADQGGPPHKRLQNLSSHFLDTTLASTGSRKKPRPFQIADGGPVSRASAAAKMPPVNAHRPPPFRHGWTSAYGECKIGFSGGANCPRYR